MALIKDPSPGGPTTDGSTIFTDQHNEIVDRLGGTTDLTANRALTTDANGDLAIVSPGTADQVLTSNGSGSAPTIQGIRRGVQIVVTDFTTDVATGNGQFYFHIDPSMVGDLIDVHAEVITAGTTGTTDIQIHNLTQAADMLSTVITIDSSETGSDTAAVAAVIDTANDDVVENDLIRIDVDDVSTTAPKGLIVTLGFRS